MKKILGITFGGLQKRSVLLVSVVMLLLVAMFIGITVYQNRTLEKIVSETRAEQQKAISDSARSTMHQVIDGSLVSATGLQASLADNDFAEIMADLRMLQTMAQGVLENRENLSPIDAALPDASNDGTSSAYVLCEDGVDFTQSEYLGYIAHMSAPMIAMQQNSAKIDSCYIGLCDGTDLCVDERSAGKLDASGAPIPFPVRARPWYVGAIEADDIYFTGITLDAFSGEPLITCSAPVEVNGETVGVVGIDVVLDSVSDFLQSTSEGSYSYVINDRGQAILGPEYGGIFSVTLQSDSQDLRSSENEALAKFIRTALNEPTELETITVGVKEYYMVGVPMPTVGWAVVNVISKEMTEQPEQLLLASYDGINEEASAKFQRESAKTYRFGFILLGVAVVIGLAAAMLAVKRMVKPIKLMTEDIVGSGRTGRPFEMKDVYRTNDEIEMLAESFADLSKKIGKYIEDITAITAEKERIGTELALATKLQAAFLPSIFPPFPGRKEFDVYASMDPAKEVGGDFYDFYLIDEDHLCLLIADVSGKGIPAALFMMVSKIILQSCAMLGRSAAGILSKTNEAICSNNKENMFVTVWIGILEISTGKLTCANAGHEYPALMRNDGSFELYRDKHGLVIGAMDSAKYKEYELTLTPGDKLFVYTDGLPEAADASNNMFGTERMLAALNGKKDASPEELLKTVRSQVDSFVGDAEQFDDLTMLCIEYHGNKGETEHDK